MRRILPAVQHALRLGLMVGVLAVTLLPIVWLISTSLKPPAEALSYPPTIIPRTFTLDNYVQVFKEANLTRFLANSLVASLVSTLLSLLIGAMAAYSLARFHLRFDLNYRLSLGILSMRMFPGLVIIIPYVIFFRNLHLLDTRFALIVAYMGLNIPFVVWMMTGFFKDLPAEMEEAAMIDGCSRWQILWKVIVPLATPGLAATGIFCFILAWNEFLFALILTSLDAKTIPVVLSGFITDKALLWGQMSAVGVLAVVPVMVIVLLLQRFFVQGLSLGAVKG